MDIAIDNLANLIARKYRTPEAAILMLESIKPIAPIIRTEILFQIIPFVPFLDVLPGVEDADISTMKYLEILNDDKSLEKLIRRMEEITKQIKEEEKEEKRNNPRPGTLSKVKSWLRR